MDPSMVEQLARDNVDLYRRVTELEALDRARLARICGLKLEVERLTDLMGPEFKH